MNSGEKRQNEQLVVDMLKNFDKKYTSMQQIVTDNISKSLENSKKHVKMLLDDTSLDPIQREKNASKFLQKCNSKLVQIARLVEEMTSFSNPVSMFGTTKKMTFDCKSGSSLNGVNSLNGASSLNGSLKSSSTLRNNNYSKGISPSKDVSTSKDANKPYSPSQSLMEMSIGSTVRDASLLKGVSISKNANDPYSPSQSLMDMSLDSTFSKFSELNISSKKIITESGDHNDVVHFDMKGLTMFDDSIPLKEYNANEVLTIFHSVVSFAKHGSQGQVDVVACSSVDQSPSSFYVHMKKSHDEFQKFHRKLQESYAWYGSEKFPALPPINCICVAYCESEKSYYRSKVISELSGVMLKVFFVDYGREEVVHLENMMRIKPKFLNLPFQAVLCSLEDIKSPTLENKWTLTEKSRFNDIVSGQKLSAELKSDHHYYNTPLKVNLHINKDGKKVELKEVLIKEGVAKNKESLQPKEIACESVSSVSSSRKLTVKQTSQNIILRDTDFYDSSTPIKPAFEPNKILPPNKKGNNVHPHYHEHFDSIQNDSSTAEAMSYEENVVVRMLVPRYSAKMLIGPQGTMVKKIQSLSKVNFIWFINATLGSQKECVLKVGGKLEHCSKAVYSLSKILNDYLANQDLNTWETHVGDARSKLGRLIDSKEFVLKFVVAEKYFEVVKSCIKKTESITSASIFMAKANSEQLKIEEVKKNDFVLSVVGTVSNCSKAFMRIVHKCFTC